MMLHEFLTAHRDELLRRCRSKVSKRDSPPVTAAELEYGVPLFLEQLVEALRHEGADVAPGRAVISGPWNKTRSAIESSRTAALHGEELLARGYTVDQVVHDYGDICQSITELARELQAPITVGEFHAFNRLLDNAIAEAVSAYEWHRDRPIDAQGHTELDERLGALGDQQRKLVETALKALGALKAGNIGLMGATGTVLEDSLMKLRDLIDRSLPEIRLETGMTTPPKTRQSS